jgi:hypothetical protein
VEGLRTVRANVAGVGILEFSPALPPARSLLATIRIFTAIPALVKTARQKACNRLFSGDSRPKFSRVDRTMPVAYDA